MGQTVVPTIERKECTTFLSIGQGGCQFLEAYPPSIGHFGESFSMTGAGHIIWACVAQGNLRLLNLLKDGFSS